MDYAAEGCYFVTICTRHHQRFFGDVVDGEMLLTAAGMMAGLIWWRLPEHHPNMVCDEFVVMPNHVHGIVAIKGRREDVAGNVSTGVGRMSAISPRAGSLSVIVRSYKAAVALWCGRNGYGDFAWQSRYYDHIIRDEDSLHNVRQYIRNNPANWHTDEENL